jgi:hypothetical protein
LTGSVQINGDLYLGFQGISGKFGLPHRKNHGR